MGLTIDATRGQTEFDRGRAQGHSEGYRKGVEDSAKIASDEADKLIAATVDEDGEEIDCDDLEVLEDMACVAGRIEGAIRALTTKEGKWDDQP